MSDQQRILDISSNLNRIVNFYIRGNFNFSYFVEESIVLYNEVKSPYGNSNFQKYFKTVGNLLFRLKTTSNFDYNLMDEVLTASTLLSNGARRV